MARLHVLLVTVACGGSPGPSLFVTTAADGDHQVSIGIVMNGDRIAAYACTDDPASDPYPGWFSGRIDEGGHFALATGGFSFSGVVRGSAASGTIVEPDGSTVPWSTTTDAHAPLTGVYMGDASCATGVVVIADDPRQPPIVRGAWCNVMQVTPVMPLELVDEKLAVDVAASTPWRAYVTPIREPL